MNTTTITFAGNLVADPELRFTPAGHQVAELRVAVNRRTKQGEEWVDATPTFHRVKVWGKTAENLIESATQGDRVLVHGHLETEAWTTEAGEQRTRDVVVVTERSGEIAISLKYATATPTKTTRTTPAEPSN